MRNSTEVSGVAGRLRELRARRGMTLRQFAGLTGVSRSMLSKIERGQTAPTATTLGRIAEGLGASISRLLGGPPGMAEVTVMRADEQPVFRVPVSNFQRRSLSPLEESGGVDVALNLLPPGQSSGRFPAHRHGVREILVLVDGHLLVHIDDQRHELSEGDSIVYLAHYAHRFDNLSREREARFVIVVDNTRAEY